VPFASPWYAAKRLHSAAASRHRRTKTPGVYCGCGRSYKHNTSADFAAPAMVPHTTPSSGLMPGTRGGLLLARRIRRNILRAAETVPLPLRFWIARWTPAAGGRCLHLRDGFLLNLLFFVSSPYARLLVGLRTGLSETALWSSAPLRVACRQRVCCLAAQAAGCATPAHAPAPFPAIFCAC